MGIKFNPEQIRISLGRSCSHDVTINHGIENLQWHPAAIEAGRVKILDVKLWTEVFLRALAIVEPHRMSDLVAAGLTRRCAVTLDFAGDESRRVALLVDEIPDRLFARPFEVMNAGINHATIGAEELKFEIADAAEWIVVIHADLVGELFSIERPAFAIAREADRLADKGQILVRQGK